MAGKIYSGAVNDTKFLQISRAQNTLGAINDAGAFIVGGGSNISTMINPKTVGQFYRAASSYGLYHYDNFKPIWK